MEKCNTYATISKGILFNILTVCVVSLTMLAFTTAYVVYTDWMPVWNKGFSDFGNIAEVAVQLQPIADSAPQILFSMQQMTKSVENMSINVAGMNTYMYNMQAHTWQISMDVGHMAHSGVKGKMGMSSFFPF